MLSVFNRKFLKYFQIYKTAIIIGVLILIFYLLIQLLTPIYKFVKENNFSLKLFTSLVFNKNLPIKSYLDRTNIIIMGISGGTHQGANLTDTIIYLSMDLYKKNTVMISIPRDIWLPSLKAKINTAYYYGEQKKKGGGLTLSKSSVSEVVGQPIHYIWLIDFTNFKKMIGLIGGINVLIEDAFEDKFYPVEGKEDDFCGGDPTYHCRYETVSFEKGLQSMDGDTVLKYVRSRNAVGPQGTDFSRAKRQQQIIVAFKNKIFQSSTWKNPKVVQELIKMFSKTIITDMNWSERLILFKYFLTLSDNNIKGLILDTDNDVTKEKGYLINPPLWQYDGVWVLVPRTSNFDEIQNFIKCQLIDKDCSMHP